MRGKFSLLMTFLFCYSLAMYAQGDTKQKNFEVYGFAMMDMGYNFKQIHPDWFDVLRPTKLAAYDKQYGTDGNTYFSARQTRLGFKGWVPTDIGELNTIVEFKMFRVGLSR